MPRRPTRSQSDTPTRKELARRLDDLGGGMNYDEIPPLTLCELLSYELETVEEQGDRSIVRIVDTDELRRRGPNHLGDLWREDLESGGE